MRTKLPKEGVKAIIGQTVPHRAWERLDEIYGNKEMSVITAMRRLRNFKGTKSAAHEQVIKLEEEVQRCRTILEGLGEVEALYSDQETIATVVQSLPRDSRERWYHRPDSEDGDPYWRAQQLVKWLETERKAAVKIHLDELSSKMKTPAPVVR